VAFEKEGLLRGKKKKLGRGNQSQKGKGNASEKRGGMALTHREKRYQGENASLKKEWHYIRWKRRRRL